MDDWMWGFVAGFATGWLASIFLWIRVLMSRKTKARQCSPSTS